jgi:YihY family inner membrane protein
MKPSEIGSVPERFVRWFDDVQQTRWWLALPIGTIRKYADDRATAFANLVTFQIFLGMLPLLVVVLTVFHEIVERREEYADAVLDSTLAQFPVIGSQLEEDISTLAVSGPWVAIAVLGLLWTAAGIYHGMQLAMNQVWNVEGVGRQGFVSRHVRALALFVLVIGAAIGTSFFDTVALLWWLPMPVAGVVAALIQTLISATLLLGVLRLTVAPEVPWTRLVPAALMAGLLWQLLQRVGEWIVTDQLIEARDLYGSIGFVVVTLMWINLLARSVVFANEWAVVSWHQLWPRRIAQPPLTEADREVLERLVRNERRRPEEHVAVWFDADADTPPTTDPEV